MAVDDDASSPIGLLVEGLTEFLDETAEADAGGWAMVERMRVAMPIELYARSDPEAAGRVAALEGRTPEGMLTSVMPVLHEVTLVVEVDRAEQREPGMEP